MGKYSQFHPLLDAMLTKLADKENTTRECWRERFDWVKAGCPISPEVKCNICEKSYNSCDCIPG